MDLTGKLIIKARLCEDVRRIPIHNEDLTYNELILMMQRVFRNTLKSTDEITVKYADDDGDLITIFDDSDITLAIQLSRVLKLTLFCKKDAAGSKIESGQIKNIREELVDIRNRVNKILDALEVDSEPSKQPTAPRTEAKDDISRALPAVIKPTESVQMTTSHLHDSGAPNTQSYNGSMFDPLTDTVKKNPSNVSTTSYPGSTREQIGSPVGSVASIETGSDMGQSSNQQQQQNVIPSSFGQRSNDMQQNSLHHTNLQSSFGDAALGGPQPSPSVDRTDPSQAPQAINYHQGQKATPALATSTPQRYPSPAPQTQSNAASAPSAPSQFASNPYTGYVQHPQQNPQAAQSMQTTYSQPNAQASYPQQPLPGSAAPAPRQPAQNMQPTAGFAAGYVYPSTSTTSGQGQYPSPSSTTGQGQYAPPAAQLQQGMPAGQPYGSPTVMSTGQPYASPQPQGQQQQYNATATPPPQQYPPPGGPGIAQSGAYNQNPHRLIRGGGGYRARQPGPGYQ